MIDLLAKLKGVARSGDGWTAHCPAHNDRHNSLSVHRRDGRWLLKCHAGCEWRSIVAAMGMVPTDLFNDGERGGGRRIAIHNRATDYWIISEIRRFAGSRGPGAYGDR
jgi:hypothetical protein